MVDILTTHEAADLLQCQPKTVEDKLRAGELPGIKMGQSWMLPREALLDRINELARQNIGKRPAGGAPDLKQPAAGQPGRKRKAIPSLGA